MKTSLLVTAAATLWASAASAATETVLYSFTGGADGTNPDAGLTIGPDGALYGTTAFGGGATACQHGCGTVFRLAKQSDGTYDETILHSFQGGMDGSSPVTELTFDAEGDIIGTTGLGGGAAACPGGCGTVFEISASGTYAQLHVFEGHTDGLGPASPLTAASDGHLYGTTLENYHDTERGYFGGGTLYSLTPNGGSWVYSVVLNFSG